MKYAVWFLILSEIWAIGLLAAEYPYLSCLLAFIVGNHFQIELREHVVNSTRKSP